MLEEKPKPTRKIFDPHHHTAYDDVAKAATKAWLKSQGCRRIRENPDIYGVDLLFLMGDEPWRAEAEVKNNWASGPFPFRSLQIPERKSRLLPDEHLLFFVWARNIQDFVVVHSSHLTDECLVEVGNKEIAEGEFFFKIPAEFCDYFHAQRRIRMEPGELG